MKALAAGLAALALAVAAPPPSAADLLAAALPVETLDGERWAAEDLRGRVVLVDFWATWCAPCLAQIPELKRIYERHRARGFEILGVAVERTSRRELRSFLRRHELPWPQVHEARGAEGELARRFRVRSVPRSFLFDADGRLVATDLEPRALAAAVEALVRFRDGE